MSLVFDIASTLWDTDQAASEVRLCQNRSRAEMAELADARGSGPRTRKGVEVRVLFSAPIHLKGAMLRHRAFAFASGLAWTG